MGSIQASNNLKVYTLNPIAYFYKNEDIEKSLIVNSHGIIIMMIYVDYFILFYFLFKLECMNIFEIVIHCRPNRN